MSTSKKKKGKSPFDDSNEKSQEGSDDWGHYEDFESLGDDNDGSSDDLGAKTEKKEKKKPVPKSVKKVRPKSPPIKSDKKDSKTGKKTEKEERKLTEESKSQKSTERRKLSKLKTKEEERKKKDRNLEDKKINEATKLDIELAFQELKDLFKKKRNKLYLYFKNQQDLEIGNIKEKINNNEFFVELKVDEEGGIIDDEGPQVKKLGIINPKTMITFKGLMKILKNFEYIHPKETVKLICMKLFAYNLQLGFVDFMKLLRQVYKFKSEMDQRTKYFHKVRKDPKSRISKLDAVIMVQKKIREFLENNRDKEEKEAEKRIARLRAELDLKIYTPEQLVRVLRNKMNKSKCNPKSLIKKYKLEEDDMVDMKLFQKILLEDLKFNGLSEEFVQQLFRAMDPIAAEKIHYNEFLKILYEKNAEEILKIPEGPMELVELLRKASNYHFDAPTKFLKFCNHQDEIKITPDEFYVFVITFSRLSREPIKTVFDFLDVKGEDFIYESNLLRLYESSKRSSKVNSRRKSVVENEAFKSFLEMSGIGLGVSGFGDQGDDKLDMGMGGIEAEYLQNDSPGEFSMEIEKHQVIQKKDKIEELILNVSIGAFKRTISQGKTIKNIFQMYADKITRKMNFDEFSEAIKFIIRQEDIDEEVLQGCYYLFAWPLSKKISYSKFLQLINMGKTMNSLYIKVKKRYGDLIDKYKQLYKDELLKMDIKEGDGYVIFMDVVKLFNINKIDVSETDLEFLKDDGIVIQKDRTNYVDLNLFMKKVFPEQSVFDKFIENKSASKIQRSFRVYKANKLVRKRQDDLLMKLGLGESFSERIPDSTPSSMKGKRKRKGKKKRKKGDKSIIEKDEDVIVKPKEVFELTGSKSIPVSDKSKRFGRSITIGTRRKKFEHKMGFLLPGRKTSALSAKMRQKVEQAVRSILYDVINKSVTYGESLCLSKKVQRRYAERPVLKDVFVLLNEAYIDVVNVMPNSLSVYSEISRMLYLTNNGILNQYDVINNKTLTEINLVTRIPSKKTNIIDYLLDGQTGNLYILKENWDLELWDIFQEKRSPKNKIRLVQNYIKGTSVEAVFKNNHLGIFPKYMNLSESKEFLVVNTTLKNSTILFIDPLSLSILNQVIFKPEDYRIPQGVDSTLFKLKPLFEKISKKQLKFSKIFGAEIMIKNNMKYTTLETVKNYFREAEKRLNPPNKTKENLTEKELKELMEYIDQDNDGKLSEEEFKFISEIVRHSETSNKVYISCEIPDELRTISKGAVNVFLQLYDYFKTKNYDLRQALSIFDANNSGIISVEEFYDILNEICGNDTDLDDKRAFFNFIDTNGNGLIELDEFERLFQMFGNYSVQELIPSECPRDDIFTIIERSYENGIDFEKKLEKYDQYAEGFIDPKSFRFLMKSLPFGVGDEEVNYYLNNSLDFTNTGDINYMNLINTERFKRTKFIFMLKKGNAEYKEKLKTSQNKENYEGIQKLIIENVLYINSIDVIAYTTVNPKTSDIFLSKISSNKTKKDKQSSASLLEQYECTLLARLTGHYSGEPPTIMFVEESGCLVSGEKFPMRKASLENKKGPSFGNQESSYKYYDNIINDKMRAANINIYNLDQEIFNKGKINPPWIIKPNKVIQTAHYDSIINLTYMKINQLIVSSSIDGCIKFWDPVAKPHQLTHKDTLQQLKPGYYTCLKQEVTKTSSGFNEVRRIYTGDLICYNLCPIYQKVKSNKVDEGIPDYHYVEFLGSLELGQSQRISGKITSRGVIKIYGVERMKLEIPVCRFEESIPKQLMYELEDLAINNRQKSKIKIKRRLPQKLEKLNSRLVIQNRDRAKIGSLLKMITMKRYNRGSIKNQMKILFDFLVNLPVRRKYESKNYLPISEIHMHLKKNGAIFPRNIGKEAFLSVVKSLVSLGSKYLVDQRTKRENKLFNLISDIIFEKNGEIESLFKKEEYSWLELKKEMKELDASDKDFEEFFAILDPFYSNKIFTENIRELFSSEIIEAKMRVFARPNFIMSQLNAILSKRNKVALLRNLFDADYSGIGYVSEEDFLKSFGTLSRKVDEILIKELFELLSERLNEGKYFINLSTFCKKLLTHSEQFELARVYNILAKLKNALRFRMLSLENIFMEDEQELRGKSLKSLSITIPAFQRKVKELKIQGMKSRDIEVMSYFLCTLDKEGTSCIAYNTIQSYFRKIDLKYQYYHLVDYKTIYEETAKIIQKKPEFLRKWQKICKKELIGFSEMRILLNYFGIKEDVIDLMLLKFVEIETSSVLFFNKIESFCEMNKFLEKPKKMEISELNKIGEALAGDVLTKKKKGEEGGENLNEDEYNSDEDTKMSEGLGSIDDLIEYIIQNESEESVETALEVCKKFDLDNTGRINLADFINILGYNLITGKCDEMESIFLKLEQELVIDKNLKSIDYTEVFDRVEFDVPEANIELVESTSRIQNRSMNLTEIVESIENAILESNLNMQKSFYFFDTDNLGLILKTDFMKILRWLKLDLSDKEMNLLYEEILEDEAVNYLKLNNLLKIHRQHINVRFDLNIWNIYGRQIELRLIEELDRNLEYIKEPLIKSTTEENPLVSAAFLEEILHQFRDDFNEEAVEKILKYAVFGSANSANNAYKKIREKDLDWKYEYVHVNHFIRSIPQLYHNKKNLPENKESSRNMTEISKKSMEIEKTHIIKKVKSMLLERGVTMWESLLSCSVSVVDKSKLRKGDFMRMLRIMNLDLTMKEKSLLLKVLSIDSSSKHKDKIDLNQLLKIFEADPMKSKKSAGVTLLLEKMVYGLYYAGYSLGRAFDKMDAKDKGSITRNEFVFGMSEFDLGLSVFEINQILEILDVEDSFTRLYKVEFKKKMKKLMRQNKINLLQNFSISLLARVQHLIESKNRNLLECFKEEDQYKSGMADLKMLKNALERFGLVNIKKHEIKTLVKVFKSNVNFLQQEDEDDEDDESENKEKEKTLSLDAFLDVPELKKEDPEEKKFDIEDENFKLDYKEFANKIYEEVEINKKLFKGSYQALRKVYNMAKVKSLTVFESFVYFDVNNLNQISNMELRLGLQNLEIPLEKFELDNLWNVFEKNHKNKVNFKSFLSAFINANCFDVIKFDDKVRKLMKKFVFLISKHGNCEEIFRKLDLNKDGYITLDVFKTQCEAIRLGFNEDEIDLVFKNICSPEEFGGKNITEIQTERDNEQEDSEQRENKPYRYFNYKKFVSVVSFFRKKDQYNKIIYKFDSLMKEKGLSYKQIIRQKALKNRKKKKERSFNLNRKKKQLGITIKELKPLIQSLSLGLNNDEINSIVNSFDDEFITIPILERLVRNAIQSYEREHNKKTSIFSKVVAELQEVLVKEHVSLQRIFFDFDSRSDGTINLEEFNNMINFLRIRLNKKELKIIFDEIDFDNKGNITFREFQAFFEQSLFRKAEMEKDQNNGLNSEIEKIIKKMQSAAFESQTSLDRVIAKSNVNLNHVASVNVFEKMLMEMNCVLKREEVRTVFKAASRDGVCSYSELVDWGIKNKIDNRAKENIFPQFPPAVQVILSKMLQIFKKLDLQKDTAFEYFTGDHKYLSMKNEFLILVQGLQVKTNEDELLALYHFFDEKNYGEISKNSFLEKCELASNFYKWSQQEDLKQNKGMMTLTLRQHVMSALEKVHSYFMEKKYNKTQIYAVFDRNGTGVISRSQFLSMIETLKIQIPIDHVKSCLNFLDHEESGVININRFLKKMIEAVPEHAKNTYRNSQALNILARIVSKLKVHIDKFMGEFLDLEKKLQINDILARNRTGVPIYDFYKLLSTYGIRLQENEKLLLNSSFKHKKKSDYFNTELFFLSLERLCREINSSLQNVEGENIEYWESLVLRKVAERLQKLNLTLEKAFEKISSSNYGFVKKVDFKQLILSLQLDLSQKDIDLLIKRLVTKQNPNLISFKEFRQRFWNCFFEGKAQIHPLNIENRSRQIAAMFLHKIKFEMQMPLPAAWDKMDVRKVGHVTLEDLKDFLILINMPITKRDLGILFGLIDKSGDSMIDQYEFAEFWNLNLPADFETRKHRMKKLENDVLGKVAKYINMKHLNLYELMKRHDVESIGYLSQDRFNQLMSEVGFDLGDETIVQIIKLISKDNTQRVYYSEFETALLRNGLKLRGKKGFSFIDFNNKLVEKFFNGLNLAANKEKVKVDQLLKQFDENYDGFLSRTQFYNLVRTLEFSFTMEEFQRLSHLFSLSQHDNQISIDMILKKHKNFKKMKSKLQEGLCDFDVFTKALQKFDPTLQLFKRWAILKQSKTKFLKYLNENKDNLRGFTLVALQVKIKQIQKKLKTIEKNIKLGLNFLKNKSIDMIISKTKLEYIDRAFNDMITNDLQKNEKENLETMENGIRSTQQFNIDYNSMQQINDFIKFYKGDLFINHSTEKVFIANYSSATLKKTMKNGKFYEDHLKYELTLHSNLAKQYPENFTKVYGVYEKVVGIEKDDKELLVFHEVLTDEWVSFAHFIESTGGLVRIPFLMTSNAVSKVSRFWFRKILEIVDLVHQKGACLYFIKPENFFINIKTLEVKLSCLRGVTKIGDDKKLDFVSDLIVIFKKPKLDNSDDLISRKSTGRRDAQPLNHDAFLAPEYYYENVLNMTQNVDSYALGAFFYFIIFGEYPKKLVDSVPIENLRTTQEPSDFIYFDQISEEAIKTIMTHDYDIKMEKNYNLLVNSLEKISFQSVFDRLSNREEENPKKSQTQNKEENQKSKEEKKIKSKYEEIKIGQYIDLIIVMMTWKPFERPSARILLNSSLFKNDSYQLMQMRQFASISFFYRSPSKCVRESILMPLRGMAAFVIENPSKIINVTNDLIKMVDAIIECLIQNNQFNLKEVKKELAREKQKVTQNSRKIMDSITFQMNLNTEKREKAPNYALIKYMFNYYVFDILLFLVLRHHKEINTQIADSSDQMIDFEKLENSYYTPIKGFKVIMQKLIFDLKDYEGASAPYVGHVLDILVKFCIGEEFFLTSEILEELEVHSNMVLKSNQLGEYKEINSKFKETRLGYFFNPQRKRDYTDTVWEKSLSSAPFCFKSNNWSLYLNSIASSLLREALGDAGLGNPSHKVIMDYVRFVTEKKRAPNFEVDKSMRYFNSLIRKDVKSVDYFNEIFVLAKNIVILNDPKSGSTSIKVVINYVKTVINARKVDKIKAILDSRILIKCLSYLQSPDVNLRESILELVEVTTRSFSRDHLYLYEQYDINSKFDEIKDIKLRSVEEIQKHFGLIAHLVVSNEDNMNKDHFSDCVRNYFMINSKICEKYLNQLSMCTVTPSFTLALVSSLKDKTEILSNKILGLKIVYNLTNAPYVAVKNLSHAALDTWVTCARYLAIKRPTKAMKQSDYLLPYTVQIFKNVMVDSRSQILKFFQKIVGLGTLLKEQKLIIPRKLTLKDLANIVEDVEFSFRVNFKQMVNEVNNQIPSNYSRNSRTKIPKLNGFKKLLRKSCSRIICWLHFESSKIEEYSVTVLQDLIYHFLSNILNYYDLLSPYSNISTAITDILIIVSNFLESLVNLGFEYFIFDTVNKSRGKNNLEWLLIQIYNIYNYFSVLEFEKDPEENEKLEELRINKIENIEFRGKELISFLKNSACLRKYSRNRLTQCGHSFLRIILEILIKNEEEYNKIFEEARFGFFFSSLIQKQYSILQLLILTKTENIHVISRYVEESNLRLRIFEAIITSSSKTLKSELLESQCIQRIPSSMLVTNSEFEVNYYRSNYKFLPFRNFQPFRSEAICMISVIFWNSEKVKEIYNELINEFVKCNTFALEVENLRQGKNRLMRLSALNFFSRLLRSGDKNIMFLLRKQFVLMNIEKVFEEDKDVALLYQDTAELIDNLTYKM